MVLLFKNSKFFLSVAQDMTYDDEIVFNDKNVTQFLAELEEYISNLITYLAFKQENPNAPISAISFDALGVKEFDRGPMAIEAPNAHEITVEEGREAVDEDPVNNRKDLFKKFMGLVERNEISFSSAHNMNQSKAGHSMRRNDE